MTDLLRELNLELTAKDKEYTSVDGREMISIPRANAILLERVKGAEKVYQRSIASGCFCKWRTGDDTHSAYLLGVKKLDLSQKTQKSDTSGERVAQWKIAEADREEG